MKLGSVPKLDKRNKTTSKKFDVDVRSQNYDVMSFFGFLANLEQSGGRIPDTESAKVMFSVIGTFCLRKTENRTKKTSNTALTLLFCVKILFWTKNAIFLQKMLTSAKLKGPRH